MVFLLFLYKKIELFDYISWCSVLLERHKAVSSRTWAGRWLLIFVNVEKNGEQSKVIARCLMVDGCWALPRYMVCVLAISGGDEPLSRDEELDGEAGDVMA